MGVRRGKNQVESPQSGGAQPVGHDPFGGGISEFYINIHNNRELSTDSYTDRNNWEEMYTEKERQDDKQRQRETETETEIERLVLSR